MGMITENICIFVSSPIYSSTETIWAEANKTLNTEKNGELIANKLQKRMHTTYTLIFYYKLKANPM